jgi:CheY-like chemotaxis protein
LILVLLPALACRGDEAGQGKPSPYGKRPNHLEIRCKRRDFNPARPGRRRFREPAGSRISSNPRMIVALPPFTSARGDLGLPMSNAEKGRPIPMRQPERSQMRSKHIFAVNGSPDLLDILRGLLQDEQYNVTTTNFVPRTFDQISALDPDLLIIDLVIGQVAGWKLLEQLTNDAATHGIPVIALSTSLALLERAEANPARFGAQRFIRKPFDLDDILAAVHDLIGPA